MSPSVSTRQLIHFLQLHMSGNFQQYDYDDENLKFYGKTHPPAYDLKNVTCPTYLYSASEDLLISPEDVEELKHALPNTVTHEICQGWNHLDVMLGRNSRKSLYKNILNSILN
jgi:pimeloyl-ACP methyl ester carboxylesterase